MNADEPAKANVEVAGQLFSRRSFTSFSGIDVETGAVTWTRSRPGPENGFGVLGSLFGINGAYVDPATGAVLWAPEGSASTLVPGLLVIGETVVHQLPGDTVLVGFERRTGREKWRARLGPHNCPDASFFGILRPVGVDGAIGYLLRTSSNEAQIVTISETGIVREVVAASEVARRVVQPRQLTVARGTTTVIAWTLYGTVAAIDVVTGAERWRADFSTLGAGFFPNPTEKTFYTPDGSLLFLQFDGPSEAEAVLHVVLNTATGTIMNRRALSRSDYRLSFQSRCGSAGFSRLIPSGLEYTDMRSGARTMMARPGLYDTMVADHMGQMYPVGDSRVLLTSSYGNTPFNSMRCAP